MRILHESVDREVHEEEYRWARGSHQPIKRLDLNIRRHLNTRVNPLASVGETLKLNAMELLNEEDIKMYFYENRLNTFEGWPFNEDCSCTPENMAKAGFIHTPSGNSPDIAMCFFCFKELEGWEPEDDPQKEHTSHSPSCHFIALKKKVEELTVEEFFKLQKERHKFIINKSFKETVTKFEEKAKLRRADIIKTVMGEE